MRVIIEPNYDEVSRWTALYVARKIQEFGPTPDKPFVLGLPTGSTPLGAYEEFVRLHRAGKISFKNVVTFNMDEYVGIDEEHPESYRAFMWRHLFRSIDLPQQNINLLNGNAPDLVAECERYENRIKQVGGIQLFLGGVGPDGHIAFNEPGSSLRSRTRITTLNYDTLVANSRFFDNDVNKVPKRALTVGVGTVADADEVLLMVNGHRKRWALQQIIEAGVSHMCTASMLQLHPNGIIVCDDEATAELKVGTVNYFKSIERDHLAPPEL